MKYLTRRIVSFNKRSNLRRVMRPNPVGTLIWDHAYQHLCSKITWKKGTDKYLSSWDLDVSFMLRDPLACEYSRVCR